MKSEDSAAKTSGPDFQKKVDLQTAHPALPHCKHNIILDTEPGSQRAFESAAALS